MSQKQPELLSSLILGPGGALEGLARRAAEQVGLAGQLRAGLPPALAEHLRAASLREDGTLVVLAASSAWAARLRFESAALLAAAGSLGLAPGRVEVKVAGPGAGD